MDLYLIRHADAVPESPEFANDSERPLSELGKAQCAALAAALQRTGVALERLYTSPYLRATQTAAGILEHWQGNKPELIETRVLAPDTKRRKVKHFFLTLEGGSIGIIGHQPDLGRWAAWLIGGKKAEVTLEKGGFAKIVCDGDPGKGTGTLTLVVTPKWFGELNLGKS